MHECVCVCVSACIEPGRQVGKVCAYICMYVCMHALVHSHDGCYVFLSCCDVQQSNTDKAVLLASPIENTTSALKTVQLNLESQTREKSKDRAKLV